MEAERFVIIVFFFVVATIVHRKLCYEDLGEETQGLLFVFYIFLMLFITTLT